MNDSTKRKAVVVTGASDGIGAELARLFAAKGGEVALVARREDRLEALANEIAATGAKRPLVVALDLCEPGADARLEQALNEAGLGVEFLINNAGFGLIGPMLTLDAAEQLAIVDLNVRALTALTLRFLPQIVAAKGGVLNVASVAGFMPGPNFTVYYATKAYVVSFTEALAQEMAPLGVKVSCLCPGPVTTGFQARAGFELSGTMAAVKPALLPAAEVARQGYEGLAAGKRVVVPGLANKLMLALVRLTPRAMLLPTLAFAQNGRK
ncbi:MAG TPA: SDR family oxidoreductase [Methylocystis sp.]|nr:SDR family oxidoreductase [Methylocystis sp.]